MSTALIKITGPFLWLGLLSCVITLAAAANEAESLEPPLVTVHLNSGRRLVAAIDQRTDQQTLWLRFDGTTAVLYRPVDWQEVQSIEHAGQLHRGPSLLSLSAQLSSQRTVPTSLTIDEDLPDVEQLPTPPVSHAELAEELLAITPRVQTIQTDAYVANWDADVEIDGIVLSITTLDHYGHAIPVSGTVSVEFRADRRSRLKPQLRQLRYEFQRFGSWTKQFPSEAGGQMVYLLPFQAVHPEFDPALAAFGLVHVKLAVPGHGVFESSIADLNVRPFSRIRDQIQQSQGTRYLPIERTGRGKRLD
jgi:hypothetical protein